MISKEVAEYIPGNFLSPFVLDYQLIRPESRSSASWNDLRLMRLRRSKLSFAADGRWMASPLVKAAASSGSDAISARSADAANLRAKSEVGYCSGIYHLKRESAGEALKETETTGIIELRLLFGLQTVRLREAGRARTGTWSSYAGTRPAVFERIKAEVDCRAPEFIEKLAEVVAVPR
ncbi:MAG: hypothetical protein BJ554DRAFT_5017 [Olpidium bornovanus]|uniref:Uncharacterized protein n=1 Tax=Olpidium bornovanus TaxID=278681 RepID=A0A8H7ZZR8_9FUNG|nr:MAG: hypothetical protein BJ554DRAFT_5017 [Olpidium bornovanus]